MESTFVPFDQVRDLSPSPPSRKLGDTTFQYQPLDPTKNEIRLLCILRGEYSEDIACRIMHVSLDDEPKFKAISYAWGDPADTNLMNLEGHEFPITRSLWDALRALRSETTDVDVWADAVCINQSDNTERGLQVQHMTEIYKIATETALWLGPEEDSSDTGINSLNVGGALESKRLPPEENDISSYRTCFIALVDLFERSYWDRLWCVQELYNARSVIVYCGHHSISWFRIRGFQSLFHSYSNLLDNQLPYISRKSRLWTDVLSSCGPATMTFPESPRISLLQALFLHRSRLCMDPRDRIYAILSLLDERESIHFIVDYNVTVRKLFTDIVVYHVAATRRLDSICLGSPDSRNQFSLPSWVPDWTTGEVPKSLTLEMPKDLRFNPAWAHQGFSAAGSSEATPTFDHPRNKLQVSGMYIDEVKDVYNRVPKGSGRSDLLLLICLWRADICRKFGYGVSLHESFCRTLLLGNSVSWIDKSCPNLIYYYLDHFLAQERPEIHPDPGLAVYGRFEPDTGDAAAWELYEGYMHQLSGRQLSSTFKSSLLCMSSGQIAAGDRVFVLFRCSVPVVLRKLNESSNEYIIVGEIYVNGYMYGKAIEELKTGERQLETVILV